MIINLPFAFDQATEKPSVTLLWGWVGNALAVLSLIILHVRETPLIATSATIIYSAIVTIFYLMRKLQHAKFDLDDKSIELESDEDDNT